MTISRSFTFNDITVRNPSQMDSEFNTIYNFLSGTSQNNLVIKLNDVSSPPLTVSQGASNPSIEFLKSSISKIEINDKGTLISKINTGTPPFTIASTTKCTNLNVGYLDDIITTAFNSNNLKGQFFNSSLQLTKLSTGTQSIKINQDSDDFTLTRTSDNSQIFSIINLEDDSNIKISLPSNTNLKVDYEPEDTDLFDVLRFKELKYSDSKNPITGAVGGNISVGTPILVYICPSRLPGIIKLIDVSVMVHISATTHTIKVYKNGVDIGTINTNSLSTLFSKSFNEKLNENDLIVIKLTAGGGSTAITVQAMFTW